MEQSLKQLYLTAQRRLFLLDYDGTLREFGPTPDSAKPTPEIKKILRDLASDSKNTVAVVSGRDRATLDEWLSELPVYFVAEHGLAYRAPGGAWQTAASPDMSWVPSARSCMEVYVASVSGSLIETKPASLVWHYRSAHDEGAAEKAHQLLLDELAPIAKEYGLRVMQGKKVVEVHNKGIDKGSQARRWLEPSSYDFVLAAGDDVTDEDLFRAVPANALTYKVGAGDSAALHRLADPAAVRTLLASLAALG